MEKEDFIKREMEKTLKQLENHERIEFSPGFQTRLLSKIHSREAGNRGYTLASLLKPLLLPVFCAILVFINMTSVIWVARSDNAETSRKNKYLTTFAGEYALNSSGSNIITLAYRD